MKLLTIIKRYIQIREIVKNPLYTPYSSLIKEASSKLQTGRGSAAYFSFSDINYISLLENILSDVSTGIVKNCYAKCIYDSDHILMLDCDSEETMVYAAAYLDDVVKIKYEIVESTKNKFWIICNYSSKDPKNVIAILRAIPGVDRKYVSYATQNLYLSIRITPKILKPSQELVFPSFPENRNLTGTPAKFYNVINKHFDMLSNLMKYPYEIYRSNGVILLDPNGLRL